MVQPLKTNIMDCPICSRFQLKDGVVHCPECNSDLGSLQLIDQMAKRHGNFRKAGIVLSILLLIAIGALATSYANRSISQESTQTLVDEPPATTDDKDAQLSELTIQVEEQQMEIDRLTAAMDESMVNADSKITISTKADQLHVVQQGESLWTISKKYYGEGSRHDEIASNNNIVDPKLISTGDTLKIKN